MKPQEKLLIKSRGIVISSLTFMQMHVNKYEPGSDTTEIRLGLEHMPNIMMMKFKGNLSYAMN
jgi:hypothetical protein